MHSALTVKQVASLLAVNNRTVYRMANAGSLPGFKVAGSWRFLEEDILNWIQERKQAAQREAGETRCNPQQGAEEPESL